MISRILFDEVITGPQTTIKRILVGLGGTPFTPMSIRRAIELAQSHQAEVTGVTLLDESNFIDDAAESPIQVIEDQERLAKAKVLIEESVADFHAACDKWGLNQRPIVQKIEATFETLVESARHHDLVVFGLKSVLECDFLCTEPQRFLVRLVATGVAPLFAITDKYRAITRVLIAYSGSIQSANAMKQFVQMRLWPDADLKIVMCGKSKVTGERLLNDAADYCRAHGYSVECQFSLDSPRKFLLKEARQSRADLIVMGNSARGVMMRRVFGDIALEVLRNGNVPVLLSQ